MLVCGDFVLKRLRSFLGGREEEVYNAIEDYVWLVLEAVKGVRKLFEAIRAGDYGRLGEIYSEIDSYETRADELRRKLSESISQGSFFSHLREDLLNLVEEIDNIADSAKDAVKVLTDFKPDWNFVKLMFEQSEMKEYVGICVEIVERLAEAINALKTDGVSVTPILREIEDMEERADEVRSSLVKKVLKEAGNYDLLNILQFKEMLYLLDNVCDSAEDSSDIILLIIAKGYG